MSTCSRSMVDLTVLNSASFSSSRQIVTPPPPCLQLRTQERHSGVHFLNFQRRNALSQSHLNALLLQS
jgi:hypothetical protein